MKNIKVFFILLALVFESCKSNDCVVSAEQAAPPVLKTAKIMSFNIQIFGVSKMAKPEVVAILTDIISQADIIAIQEVRSAGIEPVEQLMALLPEKYSYVIGPREGRTISKEQFWIIYNAALFTVLGQETWADETDIFERNPLGVYFKSDDNFDFILINNHIRPGSAEAEINALPELVDYYRGLWNEPDVLVVGDFNADGRYYDEVLLENVFDESAYKIIISNEHDTTTNVNDNTYDRFIITSSAMENYTGNFGIIRYDELYDFSQYGIEPKEVSDHYPVWAEFLLFGDTD
jgi:endonuclease/exonuclease/phosphatase family metal-dependent hydrolase